MTEYSKLNLLFTCFTFKTVYREKTIKIWLQIEINSTTTLITGEKKMFEKKQKLFSYGYLTTTMNTIKKCKFALKA